MSPGKRILLGVALLPPLAWAVVAGLRGGAESIQPCAEAHRAAAAYPLRPSASASARKPSAPARADRRSPLIWSALIRCTSFSSLNS